MARSRSGRRDAGFVYATDARPVADRVTVIRIPAWAQPHIRYEIAVVSKSSNKAAAQAWINRLLAAKGRRRCGTPASSRCPRRRVTAPFARRSS